ncbi:MAG: DUF3488 domain-containing protein [Planctomycetes bacterium]|nr:DUF3488 domain-containing protein [Planctomycetota bacterium]
MPLRNFTPIEVKLTERRRMEQPLLAMVLLAVVAFGLAEQKPTYIFMLIAVAAVAVNFFAVRRAMEISVSRLFVHIGLGIASAVGLIELVSGSVQPVVALGHYITMILVCKLFERKANRDYVQMLALSLLLLVPSGLICEEMWLGAAYLIFLGLALYTAMIFTLKRGLDAAAAARLAVESQQLAPDRVAWNVIRNWQACTIGRLACWLLAAVLLVGVAVFLIAPRGMVRDAAELGFQRATATAAGFATNIQLGHTKEIIFTNRVAMKVKIKGAAERLLNDSLMYIRGKTFNRYVNSRWRQSGDRLVDLSEIHKRNSGVNPPPKSGDRLVDLPGIGDSPTGKAVEMEFSVSPHLLAASSVQVSPTLFAPYPSVGIARVSQSRAKIRFGCDFQPTLKWISQSDEYMVYTAWSWPQPLDDSQREFLLDIEGKYFPWPFASEGDGIVTTKRVRDLAVEWTSDLLEQRKTNPDAADSINERIAHRMKARLQDRCTYSLELDGADPKFDGVDNFLFNMKKGHCEYFASSLAVMLRSVGVRARLAAGFRLDPTQHEGDAFVVRDRDGHAWVEVFTPSAGWFIVDPTPPDLTAQERAKGFWGPFRSFWQDVKTFWYEKIIGYDAASRQELMMSLKDWLRGVFRPVGELFDRIGRAAGDLYFVGRFEWVLLWPVALAGLLAAIVWLTLRRWLKRWRSGPGARRFPVAKALHPALDFLFILFDRLHAMGMERQPQQTLMEFAEHAALTLGLPHRDLYDLVNLHYRWRWGSVEPASGELADARQKADGILKLLEG